MRAALLMLALVGCGGSEGDACPAGELGEGDDGCVCVDAAFTLHDNGEMCTCADDGLHCHGGDTGSTSGSCRGVDCG